MKIRISTSALKVGMFIDAMEGSWWLNPFWRRSFLLSSHEDCERLTSSGIDWVVIDDTRGLGIEKPGVVPVPMAVAPRAPHVATKSVKRPSRVPTRPDFEVQRAAALVDRSKREVMQMFTDVRMGKAIKPQAMASVVEQICDAVGDDPAAVVKVTRLKKKNEYTYLHSVAVSALMIALARRLGMDAEVVRHLGLAGLLHDLGKTAIPEALLEKPGPLTDAEFAIVRSHPQEGRALVAEGEVPPVVVDVILHHHEKMDGTGYPDGLTGNELSLAARMAAVCDVYDAVTSKRSYKRQWTPFEALTKMRSWTGHFDPDLLDTFMRCIGIYPAGLFVRLRSNRLAIVRTEDAIRPTQPIVRAFYLPRENCFIEPEDLRLSDDLWGDAVVSIEDERHWFGDDWDFVCQEVLAGRRPDKAILDPIPRTDDGLMPTHPSRGLGSW